MAADEGAAPAGADAAALDDVEDVAVVLLEPQAVSARAAVATPAISVKLRGRSTCSPFSLFCPPPVEDELADSVNSDEPGTGRRLHRGRSRGDTRTNPVTESCCKWVCGRKSFVHS
jgi:hypothetical protein